MGAREMVIDPEDVALFWGRTERNPVTGCLEWRGPRDWDGYGLAAMRRGNGKRMFRAHRVAWHLCSGIPAGQLLVCHRCDNPPCVDGAHLFLGTAKDNFHDCLTKGRYTPKGTGNAAAKLTELEVIRIRELWSSGDWTQQAIANDFGLEQTTVSSIVLRKTWKHVAA